MRKPLIVMSIALIALVALVAVPDVAAGGRGYGTPAGTWMMKTEFEFNNPDPLQTPFFSNSLCFRTSALTDGPFSSSRLERGTRMRMTQGSGAWANGHRGEAMGIPSTSPCAAITTRTPRGTMDTFAAS